MRFRRRTTLDPPQVAISRDSRPEEVEAQIIAHYDAYGPRLHRHLRYVLHGSEQDCEEVVQETFEEFLNVLRDGSEVVEMPYPWLRTIARNKMLNRFTRAEQFGRLVPSITAHIVSSAPEILSGRAECAEGRLRRRELGSVVLEALSLMTQEERACFVAYVDGLTIKAIAAEQKIHRAFAGRLVRLGIEKFRQCLEDS